MEATDTAGPGGPTCSLCGAAAPAGEARACALCSAPHHGDCWEYTGMCSAYGCGGIVAVAWQADLVPVVVEIDGRGAGALTARTLATSLRRRLASRAGDLPATLRAGGLGAVVSFTGLVAVMAMAHGARVFHPYLLTGFFLPYLGVLAATGLAHGLLAPFLAPTQHRYPDRMAVGSGLAAIAVYLVFPTTWSVLFAASLLGTISATTLGEWAFGPHRTMGRALGRLAAPARYLFTFAVFYACGFAAALAKGFPVSPGLLTECLAWALLAAVAGGHALEIGKEEYRKHLIALVEGPAEEEES